MVPHMFEDPGPVVLFVLVVQLLKEEGFDLYMKTNISFTHNSFPDSQMGILLYYFIIISLAFLYFSIRLRPIIIAFDQLYIAVHNR